jgi:hypothetical protein
MKRNDRRDENYDNSIKHPQAKRKEPASSRELEQLLGTVRAQRDEAKQSLKDASSQLVVVQDELQVSDGKVREWEEQATQNHQFYLGEQEKYQNTLCLYNEERSKASELLVKYEEADAQRGKYLTLYNETKTLLIQERRSKAGIKGWETRRKQENQKLKQEIAEMVVVLQESLQKKDEAIDSLYSMADRMDRIQKLVDLVDDEPTNTPAGLVPKLGRIWMAIKNILAE